MDTQQIHYTWFTATISAMLRRFAEILTHPQVHIGRRRIPPTTFHYKLSDITEYNLIPFADIQLDYYLEN